MNEFPKPTAGALTGEFISFKRDMIPKRPVRAVTDSSIEIGTRITFAGLNLIDPGKFVVECQRYGVAFDWWWGKANGWKSQRGRMSGNGTVLMLAGDYDDITNPQQPIHPLIIESGADSLEVWGLAVLDASVAMASGSTIREDTPLVLSLVDARYYAAHQTVINHVYNLRRHDGTFDKGTGDATGKPVSSQRIVKDIWERWLQDLFGVPLSIHASASESVPNIDNLLFSGWTAWDAFWHVLDINGWNFAIIPQTLSSDAGAWVFKNSEGNPQAPLQLQATSRALIQSYQSTDRSPLPETITVVAPARGYQWYRDKEVLTPQDHWRKHPSQKLEYSLTDLVEKVDASRIIPGSNQIVWCPQPAISNDQNEFVNEDELKLVMESLAEQKAASLVHADISDEHEFALLWDFHTGSYYQSVEWIDDSSGLVTRISHIADEHRGDANSGSLIPIDVFDYHEPPTRLIIGLVQIGSSSPSGNPDIPSDSPNDVQPNEFCKVNVLSGHVTDGGGSNWIERDQVDAINVTDGSIKAGARVFAIWNYQVGEGGAWCIVAASETPIKVDDLALLRITGPASSSELGAAVISENCLYDAEILAISKEPCQETWDGAEKVSCFDFRAYLPKAVISFGEVYLGFLVSPSLVSRRLFGIVCETPNLQRVKNTGQTTLEQFRPAEVIGHESTPKDFAHHHVLTVSKVEGDYVHFCIMAFPCKYNEIGWAWTHGTCPAYLAVRNGTHHWADVRSGATALTSGHEGAARIVQRHIALASELGLVQLGELEDVAVCGKLLNDIEGGAVNARVMTEGGWIQADVHYDCVQGCNLKAGTQVLIQFGRVPKFWRIIGFPPALRTGVGTTCVGIGNPPLNNDCMEKIVWMKGLKANYDTETIVEEGKPDIKVKRIKVGPSGLDGSAAFVTDINCSNGVITFTKQSISFECGIFTGLGDPTEETTDCCIIMAGTMPNPTLDTCMCCGGCPDCTTCAETYNVNVGSPFAGICSCQNATVIQIFKAVGCAYSGSAATGCLEFVIDCLPVGDPEQMRCNGEIDGDLCFDCSEAPDEQVGAEWCCPTDTHGLRLMSASLDCVDGYWVLHLNGGTVGPCPHVTWNAMGSKPAGGQCPTGTYSMEFQITTKCDELNCNDPEIFTSPVTIS